MPKATTGTKIITEVANRTDSCVSGTTGIDECKSKESRYPYNCLEWKFPDKFFVLFYEHIYGWEASTVVCCFQRELIRPWSFNSERNCTRFTSSSSVMLDCRFDGISEVSNFVRDVIVDF